VPKKKIKEKKIKYNLIELHISKINKNYSKKKIKDFLERNSFYLIKKFKFPLFNFVDCLYEFRK